MSVHSSDSEKGFASQASSLDETNYLCDTRVMRWARATLATISLMLAAAAVGCEANVLRTYYKTNVYDVYWLSVWPSTLNIGPTEGIIASSALMLVLNLGFFIALVIPYRRAHLEKFNIATAVVGVIGMIITITAVAYSYTATNPRYLKDGPLIGHTIKSWTCTWQTAVDPPVGERIEAVYPFERLCRQSQSSFGINFALAVLSFFMLISAAVGWRMAQKIEMKRSGAFVEKEPCGEVRWNEEE